MVIFKDFLMWKLNENIGKMGRLFLDGSLVIKKIHDAAAP